MGKKILSLFIVILLVVYQRTKFDHDKTYHYPPNTAIALHKSNLSNYFTTGFIQTQPQLSLLDVISRKKINNYLFTHEGAKIEVALIDLGYISILNINYFKDNFTVSFEEKIRFSLKEDFNDYTLTVNKQIQQEYRLVYTSKLNDKNNSLSVESNFNIFIKNQKGTIKLSLTNFQPIGGCVNYFRNGVISRKCYGGYSIGNFSYKQEEGSLNISLRLNESSGSAFDGFRASGWQWQWVWGMGSGFNANKQQIGINFGSIRGIGEDTLHINNYSYPLQDLYYEINENFTSGQQIKFRSKIVDINMTFSITVREHKYQDMGILKSDMIKFQGYWSGCYLIQQRSHQRQCFEHVPGLVQTADSIF